jgi:hypothetical protein
MASGDAPACGLYRTGLALTGNEEQVPSGILVYFHDHSGEDGAGPPMVVTPHDNEHNRWRFHERGWIVEDEAFVAALVPLAPEGLYVNTQHLHITREEIIPERMLVQLGYNRRGDTVLFVGRLEGNAIVFPERGYAFESPEVQKLLEPAGFDVARPRPAGEVH